MRPVYYINIKITAEKCKFGEKLSAVRKSTV